MSSAEFIDYVGSLLPNLGQETQLKASYMLMHMITLMRSFDKVELQKVRYGAGKIFTAKIMRHTSLVSDLAHSLGIKTEMPYKPESISPYVQRRAYEIGIDIAEVQSRHNKLDSSINEICRLALFVQVARTVMQAMHEDTLHAVDNSYQGHCHPSYVPKAWIFGRGNPCLLGLKAFELPGAHTPRAVAPRPTLPIPSAASSAKSASQSAKRAPAPTSGSISTHTSARRAAHPYARHVAASRTSYTGASRTPRYSAQRPIYPSHIPTQNAHWHSTNVHRVPAHIASY